MRARILTQLVADQIRDCRETMLAVNEKEAEGNELVARVIARSIGNLFEDIFCEPEDKFSLNEFLRQCGIKD